MARKHKKKIYNTPKKIAHVNKTNSLSDFINSFSNQKCANCRSILALHDNRTYCGKCQNSEFN